MKRENLEERLETVKTIGDYERLLYEVGNGWLSRSEAKQLTSGIVSAIRAEKSRKPVQDLITSVPTLLG